MQTCICEGHACLPGWSREPIPEAFTCGPPALRGRPSHLGPLGLTWVSVESAQPVHTSLETPQTRCSLTPHSYGQIPPEDRPAQMPATGLRGAQAT